ncbi:MAG: 3-isopropylmalate dehydratase large subunit [uncultured Arthrobacter sp.]|uniref:3-isopropylmalate dehydratase large subunit n=2 Tax=uncultured Arthrobacter sp. TaxID=114050 RepID=A0A6J4J778_9MICC|nr:MAG: 3-isopropylmalate dehydratase large subunit [uncultured Arthrobacter sp.]
MTAKILARAAGKDVVAAGDVLLADVDVLTVPDAERFIDVFVDEGLRVWDPSRIVFCFDHFFADWMPSGAVREHPKIHRFSEDQGIPRDQIYDLDRNGLSHQVPVEEGWILPGTVSIGADTQSATMGAMNCFSMPALSSGTTAVALTGKWWIVVPECIRVNLTGALPAGVLGKDVAYRLIRDMGGFVDGRVLEFAGPGVASLPIDVRMGIANGAIQIGAQTVVFPGDQRLLDYLRPRARAPFVTVEPDEDAPYYRTIDYDLSTFECLVSGPHEIDLIRPVSEVAGTKVHAANIGSCSSGRLEDLKLAAEVLEGHVIHSDVRMAVTPISASVMRAAERTGILDVFRAAGAVVSEPGCGGCYHGNRSPIQLQDDEVCISTSVENLSGRMGGVGSQIYLGSAAVVAASAIGGAITDPAPYLEGKVGVR